MRNVMSENAGYRQKSHGITVLNKNLSAEKVEDKSPAKLDKYPIYEMSAAHGAGRVEAMLGFSPPSRQVALPPGVRCRELLVHVDRIEDWTPRTP